MSAVIGIIAAQPELKAKALALAAKYHLPFVDSLEESGWLIKVTSEHVELVNQKDALSLPFWVDFLQGRSDERRRKLANGASELILRAIGVKKTERLSVWDLTAGWGRDAFMLASAGCDVTLVEGAPSVALLLADGIERLFEVDKVISREAFKFVFANAMHYLSNATMKPDVIYLDPMYPERNKAALVKKEMQILHELAWSDIDEVALFQRACEQAKQRVVVKRPIYAPPLTEVKPSHQYKGKHTRFDVYLIK